MAGGHNDYDLCESLFNGLDSGVREPSHYGSSDFNAGLPPSFPESESVHKHGDPKHRRTLTFYPIRNKSGLCGMDGPRRVYPVTAHSGSHYILW
jgi:hypothetical protein